MIGQFRPKTIIKLFKYLEAKEIEFVNIQSEVVSYSGPKGMTVKLKITSQDSKERFDIIPYLGYGNDLMADHIIKFSSDYWNADE